MVREAACRYIEQTKKKEKERKRRWEDRKQRAGEWTSVYRESGTGTGGG